MQTDWIRPDWPAPMHVMAVSTTRLGGVSVAPFDSMNLGSHVGDSPAAVASNRAIMRALVELPMEPCWLQQVHGTRVVECDQVRQNVEADASVTRKPGWVCAVMTADCLPVLFTDKEGTCVAAAHAGWRGLADGMLEETVAAMGVKPASILAWLGPAIGPDHFEVGEEVKQIFETHSSEAREAFKPAASEGKWMANMAMLARQRLHAVGVERIYGGDQCTFANEERFFSYRRDGRTGRMASMIWLAP